jgi:hypothetical protein
MVLPVENSRQDVINSEGQLRPDARLTTCSSLVIYVAPTCTINIISLSLLCEEGGFGHALKDFLEKTQTMTKVFFDARMSAKVLFERCGINLANPVHSCSLTSLIVPSGMHQASL